MCFLNHDLKTYCEKTTDLNKERVWAVFSISTQGVIHLKSAALATKDDSDGEFLFEHDNNTVTFVFVSHVFLRSRKIECLLLCFQVAVVQGACKQPAAQMGWQRVVGSFLGVMAGSLYIHITRSFCLILVAHFWGLSLMTWRRRKLKTNLCC